MMMTKAEITNWIKQHKKEIVISGISIAAIILAIKATKNTMLFENIWPNMKRSNVREMKKSIVKEVGHDVYASAENLVCDVRNVEMRAPMVPHDVNRHIRNLPKGWSASEEKVISAAQKGIILGPQQTWVDSYRKGVSAVAA